MLQIFYFRIRLKYCRHLALIDLQMEINKTRMILTNIFLCNIKIFITK